MSERLYIIAAKRTPMFRISPATSARCPIALGIAAARAALMQSGAESSDLDGVIVGQSLAAGLGMGVARQIALGAGIADEVPAASVNMAALSGMKALIDACTQIKAGDADLILTVATDAASRGGFFLPLLPRHHVPYGHVQAVDLLLHDALESRGQALYTHAEALAQDYAISRESQDDFARNSLQQAAFAEDNGRFDAEIVQPDMEDVSDDIDEAENMRIAQCLPRQTGGTVTDGNSAPLADGASAILIASESALRRFSLVPLAEIIGYGSGGVAPEKGVLGATPAIAQALERGGCRLQDIERLEIEESFAAEALAILYELGEEHEMPVHLLRARTNPGGGALALGHSLACSGHRLVTTLTYGLARDNQGLGLAAQGSSDGLGCAMLLSRI